MKAIKRSLTPKNLTPSFLRKDKSPRDPGPVTPGRRPSTKKFSLTPKSQRYAGLDSENDPERKRYEEEADSIASIVDFLMDDDPRWAELAANDLWDKSTREDCRYEISENGGIECLVEICASGAPEMSRRASGCLRNLALEGLLREKIMDNGGIEVLVRLVGSDYVLAAEEAVAALWNLSTDALIAARVHGELSKVEPHPLYNIVNKRNGERELLRLAQGCLHQIDRCMGRGSDASLHSPLSEMPRGDGDSRSPEVLMHEEKSEMTNVGGSDGLAPAHVEHATMELDDEDNLISHN